jgi:hypothetical protein
MQVGLLQQLQQRADTSCNSVRGLAATAATACGLVATAATACWHQLEHVRQLQQR